MTNLDKLLIREDVEFIKEYIDELVSNTKDLGSDNAELIVKMKRRLDDIESRVEA